MNGKKLSNLDLNQFSTHKYRRGGNSQIEKISTFWLTILGTAPVSHLKYGTFLNCFVWGLERVRG